MSDFASILSQGGAAPWLFIPTAILLGALHGLEPGHSKTMMAAFIVAVCGTVKQAVLLGLAATASHTMIVWLVAMGGLYLGGQMDAQTSEPYFQVLSAVMIIGISLWMVVRLRREHNERTAGHHHHHDHGHHHHDHDHGHTHHHDHSHEEEEYQDAHERAHAMDIARRFDGQNVTTGQIIMFGLTGGLIPCPAAITVLLLCLQLKKITLGATLVLGFSVGLALTLVVSGVVAALSVRYASRKWSGFGTIMRRAPYVSCAVIMLIGLYVGYHGLVGILGS